MFHFRHLEAATIFFSNENYTSMSLLSVPLLNFITAILPPLYLDSPMYMYFVIRTYFLHYTPTAEVQSDDLAKAMRLYVLARDQTGTWQ